MHTFYVLPHTEDDGLTFDRFGDDFIMYVGWRADPDLVQTCIWRFSGISLNRVVFETSLPEGVNTRNNVALASYVVNQDPLVIPGYERLY